MAVNSTAFHNWHTFCTPLENPMSNRADMAGARPAHLFSPVRGKTTQPLALPQYGVTALFAADGANEAPYKQIENAPARRVGALFARRSPAHEQKVCQFAFGGVTQAQGSVEGGSGKAVGFEAWGKAFPQKFNNPWQFPDHEIITNNLMIRKSVYQTLF
jgi:hypothetical protein